MTTDQYTFTNPAELYADFEPKKQHQPEPGLDAELVPKADLGEKTYRGTGRLTGRRALITGADSGIGAATAIAFAREGADVAMSYLPEEDVDAQRIAQIMQDAGVKVLTLPGDLRDAAYCRDLVDKAVKGLGGLDILVNNGGKQVYNEDLATLDDEQFDDTFKTNVYAMFWITKAALPHLRRARRSSTPPRCRRTSRLRSSSTTPRPRRRSTRSRRRSRSSSRRRGSA